MAMNAPGLPQYLGPRMNALPRVNAGPHATAEAFGAGNARELMRLGAVGQRAGLSMLARAQEEQKRIDQAYVRDAMNQARTAMMEGAQSIYAKNGIDAANAPEEMQALLSSVKARYGGSCGPNSRSCSTGGGFGGGNIERQRMLEDAWGSMSASYSQAAVRHKIKQERVYEKQTLDMQDLALLQEVEAMVVGTDPITGSALDPVADGYTVPRDADDSVPSNAPLPTSVPVGNHGDNDIEPSPEIPPEVAERVEAEIMPQPHLGDEIAKRIQLLRHNAAIRYAGSPPEYIREKQNETESKVHSLVADTLAEQNPQQALDYLNMDRVRAVMPRTEWKKRRDAAGKVAVAEAKKRSENAARHLGIALGDKFDHEYEIITAIRDVEDRSIAKIIQSEAETTRKARLAMGNAARQTPEEKAKENRLAREQAKTILLGEDPDDPSDDIEDEDSLDLALDERGDLTEYMREKVRKYAVAEMKTKKARLAADRKKLDESAISAMAAAGWDASAIDPSWPLDLQDKMLERALKREEAAERRESRAERATQKARGVELLEMPLDRLNEKILAGEYPDMVDAVGAGTPEHEKLKRRLAGEDAGGLTLLQYAKNEFTRLVGKPTKKATEYAEFLNKVAEARSERARALQLDNVDLLPRDDQKRIIGELLTEGDWRWFWNWGPLSRNKFRFQVADEDLPGWKPFDTPAAASTTSTLAGADDLPDFARPYIGPRDRRRQVLTDGRVLIEAAGGTISIINQDGTFTTITPRGSE